jgi:hypothetical protein
MKKQTAVQYFASKVMYLNITPSEMHDFLQWYEEAKKIEKEQIIEAYLNGEIYGEDYHFRTDDGSKNEAEFYFKETFK